MKTKEQEQSEGRRGFLKLASVGTVAGAAATLIGSDAAKAALPDETLEGSGYRETAHVKKVYDLSRF